MKFKEFRRQMKKDVFTTHEAQIVAYAYQTDLINLQLHTWTRLGELTRLKRGVYLFTDSNPGIEIIASQLCSPCYFSLEYILNLHGIIPEAVFTYTLVTTRPTRTFRTPRGDFSFRTIRSSAFAGFDTTSLLATPEKALIDYLYLNSSRLEPSDTFWDESRLRLPDHFDLDLARSFAALFHSRKLGLLLTSLYSHAASETTGPASQKR
ncbi:hypothetical protein AUK40_04835 [Candidatus Wirthbacteria bacterium CG2_30_54_11]|uniref:AbiEi antitoxin C-terminal domain-containing protein n=1 Tax=Candidatus Wirthbacteria bacterium CG2_30_54_11 TaxID=1817892 RepID=A0A1J5IHM6_9BACT|nr:MAG: hypothetical protein AUK40_04835 [Candidatus Wirthbacteria bacterium CG2_30_54_11]